LNALITYNFGDYLQGHARESLQHAAGRWGCEYVEVTKQIPCRDGIALHPWWQRIVLYEEVVDGYERVITVDGDILIRDDCQSLFDLVPVEHAGIAKFMQPGIAKKCCSAELRTANRYAIELGLKIPPVTSLVNCGLVVSSPKTFLPIVRELVAAGKFVGWTTHGNFDQAIMSTLLYNHGLPEVSLIPWEYHARRAAHRPPKMNAYVYHFSSTEKKPYHYYLNKCQWRTQ